ncbi:MAG: hypothetical protein JNK31_09720 [Candidatus Competibacter sp.]|nr:hypothetical protein [Candidatus Competibacter sp.]
MAVMKDAGLNFEQTVQVRAEHGCVIIEPTPSALDDLLPDGGEHRLAEEQHERALFSAEA